MAQSFSFHKLSSFLPSFLKANQGNTEDFYSFGSVEKYNQLNGYHTIYDSYNSRTEITTTNPINYSDRITFGSTYRSVRKALPKCTFRVSNKSKGLDRKIAVFKRRIAGQNVKIEMHFFQDKLFFFNYTFSYANAVDRERLTQMLIEKYQVNTTDLLNNTIFDSNKNCILVTEGTEFCINYIQTENSFFEQLNTVRFSKYRDLSDQNDVTLDHLFASL